MAVAFAGRLELASRFAAPQLLCDEFIYAGVARSIAELGRPELRGAAVRQNLLYPAAIAPGWLLGSTAAAYAVAKALNVVAMTSSALLVYLWSRSLVAPLLRLAVTALVLAMPWFEYTGLLMTENLFLPVFVGAAFAAAKALERPTPRRQLLALALVGVAYLTRTQGLVLLPILVTALLFFVLLGPTVRARESWGRRLVDELRPWWVSAVTVAAAGIAYLVWITARGESWKIGLGDYAVVLDWQRSSGDVAHWARENLAAITLTSGIVPLAALVALSTTIALRPREPTSQERALAAVGLSAVVWITVQVGIFATEITSVAERYTFYVEPVLFLALVTWFARPRPYRFVAAGVGAAAALALVLGVPVRDYATSILPNNVGLYSLYDLSLRVGGGATRVETLVHIAAFASLAILAILPRRLAAICLVTAVGGWLLLSSYRVHPPMGLQAAGSAAVLGDNKAWIDDAVGRNANVTYVYSASPDGAFDLTRLALETEFWNRSVRSVTAVQGTELCGLPERAARLVPVRAGLAVVPSPHEHLVAQLSSSIGAIGDVVATGLQQTLYRARRPLTFDAFTTNIASDGWTAGTAFYVHLGHRRGNVVATLSRPRWSGPDVASLVTISAAPASVDGITLTGVGRSYWRRRWTVHSGSERTFRVPIGSRPTALRISVDRTFSPAAFGLPDTRSLGVQAAFRFRPSS